MMKGDARCWDESAYRQGILQHRLVNARTVFSAIFSPLDRSVVVACSDGTVAPYSIPVYSSTSSVLDKNVPRPLQEYPVAKPLCSLTGHTGPAYDLEFFGDGDDALLLSCGDDGRIQLFSWQRIKDAIFENNRGKIPMPPALEIKNPQQKGPWNALNEMPETNALACDYQRKCIFSAAGDGCAYSWDVETGKLITMFKGHSDYLHCISARTSQNQIITGSEDGTVRVWDCRSGQCIAALDPFLSSRISKRREASPWVSCIALDKSENWLACGSGGNCITLWSLPGMDAIERIATQALPQDLKIVNNQIVMVGAQPSVTRFSLNGKTLSQVSCAPTSVYSIEVHPSGISLASGYGGLIDIISEFGSHIGIFRC